MKKNSIYKVLSCLIVSIILLSTNHIVHASWIYLSVEPITLDKDFADSKSSFSGEELLKNIEIVDTKSDLQYNTQLKEFIKSTDVGL
ncbi:MAG: hypothetical protein GX270_03580 [Clostridiaceae bacterium]|nr:hypothetical protein [Clostridiaceae bacterium]